MRVLAASDTYMKMGFLSLFSRHELATGNNYGKL